MSLGLKAFSNHKYFELALLVCALIAAKVLLADMTRMPLLSKEMSKGPIVVEQSLLPPPAQPDPLSSECRKDDEPGEICRI